MRNFRAGVSKRNKLLYLFSYQMPAYRFLGLRIEINFRYYTYDVPGHALKPHRHPDFEFERVVLGRNIYTVDGCSKKLSPRPGQFIVMPDGINHDWILTEAPIGICRYWVSIQSTDDSGRQIATALRQAVEKKKYLFDTSEEIDVLEQSIWDLLGSGRAAPVVSSLVSLKLQQLIVMFIERCLEGKLDEILKGVDYRAATTDAPTLVGEMERFIEANLCKVIQTRDLSDHFHFSSRHLNRMFVEVKGCSVGAFIKQRKVEITKGLLINTSRTVKDISFSLGYPEASHFSRFFYKNTGLSPDHFRVQYSDTAKDSELMKQKHQL